MVRLIFRLLIAAFGLWLATQIVPGVAADAHKWQHAVWIVAGSPGMGGAASLCAGAAARTPRCWQRRRPCSKKSNSAPGDR